MWKLFLLDFQKDQNSSQAQIPNLIDILGKIVFYLYSHIIFLQENAKHMQEHLSLRVFLFDLFLLA